MNIYLISPKSYTSKQTVSISSKVLSYLCSTINILQFSTNTSKSHKNGFKTHQRSTPSLWPSHVQSAYTKMPLLRRFHNEVVCVSSSPWHRWIECVSTRHQMQANNLIYHLKRKRGKEKSHPALQIFSSQRWLVLPH